MASADSPIGWPKMINLQPYFHGMEKALNESAMCASPAPWQEQLKEGDFYVRFTHSGFVIYGELVANANPLQMDRKKFRTVREYTFVHPEGLTRSIHIGRIVRSLTPEAFDAARAHRWQ